MLPTPSDTIVDLKTYSIRLRNRGQVTLPLAVRESLAVAKGDTLTLLQVGEAVLLIPRHLQTPQLSDKIITMMETKGVSLATLLSGLVEERKVIWRERYEDM